MVPNSDPIGQDSPDADYSSIQLRLLGISASACFMSNFLLVVPGPLYPPEARSKGLTPSYYGLLLSCSPGVLSILTWFTPYFQRFGMKQCLVGSCYINGLVAFLLGGLNFIQSYEWFVIGSFVTFVLQGISLTGILISSYISCNYLMGASKMPLATGIIEFGYMGGECFAPIISEFLYTLFGWTLTFIIFGIIQLCVSLIAYAYFPSIPKNEVQILSFREMTKGYRELISSPSVLLYTVILGALQMVDGFLNVVLESGVQPFNLTPIGTGNMFFAAGAPRLMTPVWGYILGKVGRPQLILAVGLFIVATSTCLFGPLPFIPVAKTYYGTVFGLILFGVGYGIMDVGSVVNLQFEVQNQRAEYSDSTNFTFFTIVYGFVTGVGGLFGPAIAGVLFEHFGFSYAVTLLFGICGVLGLLVLLQATTTKCRPRNAVTYESID